MRMPAMTEPLPAGSLAQYWLAPNREDVELEERLDRAVLIDDPGERERGLLARGERQARADVRRGLMAGLGGKAAVRADGRTLRRQVGAYLDANNVNGLGELVYLATMQIGGGGSPRDAYDRLIRYLRP